MSATHVLWLSGRSYRKTFYTNKLLALCHKPRHAKFQRSSAKKTLLVLGLNGRGNKMWFFNR